ncbi:hypothetical protein GMOD_00003170 [Pyrenophora seminiperda CCB06]|uniref:Uncharacterized protein n=1 Tax=Pyrenophora seminiperda CCB06 TaxID=1302712 RepID=A0A3M7M4A7_9PLEO|nr:hypothetical protein GMOD_00003170 [Pyrenophora seminiperda CCB06]
MYLSYKMVSFTTLLALSGAALASSSCKAPEPDQKKGMEIPGNWTWQVTGWEAGCARQGCYYDFNVTMPSVPGKVGGVKAHCQGNENWFRKGNTYKGCQLLDGVNNRVSAKLSERTSDSGTDFPTEILVSFEFGKGPFLPNPSYNFTGSHKTIYNAAVEPLQNFTIVPTTVTAVPY